MFVLLVMLELGHFMPTQGRRYLMYISQNYSYAILRPLQQTILAQGGEVCWFLEGHEVNPDYLASDEIRLNSVDEIRTWQPDAVFVPGNVVPDFIPGIKVGVFHGFNSGKVNRRGREDHFEIRGFFDLYCTQGPQTTEPFLKLKQEHGFFHVKETGWPAIDPLFHQEQSNPYIKADDPRPTILMCSTFSQSLSCAPQLFEQVKRMSESGKWRWLVQFHPKMSQNIVDQYKSLQSDNLQFVETDNIIPLLKSADVMLCDTSSVLLMFALQRKPIVTFRNRKPLPHLLNVSDPEQVESALEKALNHSEQLMKEIDAYASYIHPYNDGCSSERVLEETNKLIESGLDGMKSKPLNLLRKFKLRKKLGYWKL